MYLSCRSLHVHDGYPVHVYVFVDDLVSSWAMCVWHYFNSYKTVLFLKCYHIIIICYTLGVW